MEILNSIEASILHTDEIGYPERELDMDDWTNIESLIHKFVAEFPGDSEISQFAHLLGRKPRT